MTVKFTDLAPKFRLIAQSLAIQWPGIAPEDIAQEMSTKTLERWDSLSGAFSGDAEQDSRMILRFAKREGIAYCSTERHFWQMQTAEWVYTPKEVRALLAEFFNADAWEDAPKRSEGSAQTVTGDGISVALMDIRSAFEQIPEGYQAIILTTYREHTPDSSPSGRKRLQRAIDSVTNRLNWRMAQRELDREFHDGPGSRTAMSNAQARHAIDY